MQTCATSAYNFYPRPPRGGRLLVMLGNTLGTLISIHALREEGDETAAVAGNGTTYFYPRPPRGGRHLAVLGIAAQHPISIHALREEGDHGVAHFPHLYVISIHALREEGDRRETAGVLAVLRFLSTPSARRATDEEVAQAAGITFLSTPSARRATKQV